MRAYALRRILQTIPVLLAATLLTFALVSQAGDPLGALRSQIPPVPAATIAAARHGLYLDRGFLARYWLWLTGLGSTHGDIGLLRGRFGPSNQGIALGHVLIQRFLVSLTLVGVASGLTILVGLAAGAFGASRQNRLSDRMLSVIGLTAFATPTFYVAVLLKRGGVWLNHRLGTHVVYTIGETSPGSGHFAVTHRVSDLAGHLVLPTIALVLGGYSLLARHQRAAMLDVIDSDHVRLARAKGLAPGAVMRRHALRTSLIPSVNLAARVVSGALAGSIIVEYAFGWQGLGSFLLSSVDAADPYAVMDCVLLAVVLVVLSNLAADLLCAWLDPRLRTQWRA